MQEREMRRLNSVLAILILLLVVLTGFYSCANEVGTSLKFDPKKGQVYDCQAVIEVTMGAAGYNSKMNVVMGYRLDLKEIRKEERVLNYCMTCMKFDSPFQPNGQDLSFDSEEIDTSTVSGKILRKMIGHQFNLVISTDGKVKEVIGNEELYSQL